METKDVQVWECGFHSKEKNVVSNEKNVIATLDGTILTISGNGCMQSYGKTLYSYKYAPWYRLNITSVVIQRGITNIGSCAFLDCYGITSVCIPDSVTCIGSDAFKNCTGLTHITFSENLISIGAGAFYGCAGLTSVTFLKNLKEIGIDAFKNCTGLTRITFSENLISIDARAFYGCASLTSITFLKNLKEIGYRAFQGCSKLKSITNLRLTPQIIPYLSDNNEDRNCSPFDGNILDGKLLIGKDKSITLFVPASAVNVYKNAPVWQCFCNIMPIAQDEQLEKIPTPEQVEEKFIQIDADVQRLEERIFELMQCFKKYTYKTNTPVGKDL
ncbi:hypothetical protein FACS189467_8750 [Bacteroidia bacterium]|nr:hypothetical protein FACS189467_8750 [Bacteroidia bacterium]